jgi:hypothetical protein
MSCTRQHLNLHAPCGRQDLNPPESLPTRPNGAPAATCRPSRARVSSNSSDAAPARSTSQSSMLSAPASIAPIDQLGDPSFSHRYSQVRRVPMGRITEHPPEAAAHAGIRTRAATPRPTPWTAQHR